MKKIISNLILLIFFALGLSIIVLSTIGIETKKFNSFVSNKINQTNNNNRNKYLRKDKFNLKIKE